MAGVLDGLKVVELAGLGPAPFCAMLLADMGAEVVRIERPAASARLSASDVLVRGRQIVELDLKDAAATSALRTLIKHAEVLIEGYRPGVMERLGLGPAELMKDNPALVYARMTGWGQTGPLADRAGHDINYIAISGVLHAIGSSEGPPAIPLNLIGDFGGGGMLLATGILAAVLRARQTGEGQVIDAAMSDGASLLSSMMWGFMHAGQWKNSRGSNFLDGAAHFYTTYRCADGKYVAVGAIEPQFYETLLKGCGLSDAKLPSDYRNPDSWEQSRSILAQVFEQKTRDQWCEEFEGQDACVAPVLDWQEALSYAHNQSRSTFTNLQGVVQPAPAPRFSKTPSEARDFRIRTDGVDGILRDWQTSGV